VARNSAYREGAAGTDLRSDRAWRIAAAPGWVGSARTSTLPTRARRYFCVRAESLVQVSRLDQVEARTRLLVSAKGPSEIDSRPLRIRTVVCGRDGLERFGGDAVTARTQVRIAGQAFVVIHRRDLIFLAVHQAQVFHLGRSLSAISGIRLCQGIIAQFSIDRFR